MAPITEGHLEQQAIEWFREIGYSHAFGPELAPDGSQAERADYRQVVLQSRLRSALRRLNPEVPPATIESAVLQLSNPNVPGLMAANRQMHRWLTQGLPITYMDGNEQRGIRLRVIAFDEPAANDWLVVNQLAVQGPKHNRRPDLVVYVNGLPLAVLELKNPTEEKADIWAAFNQLQTYKTDIPDLFLANVLLVISDGVNARVGSLSADRQRFQRWRTIAAGTRSGVRMSGRSNASPTTPLSVRECGAVPLPFLRDRQAVMVSPRRGDGQPTPAPETATHHGPVVATWW